MNLEVDVFVSVFARVVLGEGGRGPFFHSMTVKISGISIISTSPSVLKIYFAIHVLKRFSSVSDPPNGCFVYQSS